MSGPAAVLFDVDLAEIGEILDDALPFKPAAADRETVDQLLAQDQGEEGAEDVAADADVGLVENWAGGEQRLSVLKASSTTSRRNTTCSAAILVLVRSTKRPSNRASASTLARSMMKPPPAGVFRKRRKPLLATSPCRPERAWARDRRRVRRGIFFGFPGVTTDNIAPPPGDSTSRGSPVPFRLSGGR